MTKTLTKKQNKKIIANDCKKAKKESPKAQAKPTTTPTDDGNAFRVALRENADDIKKALRLTKAQRKAYAQRLFDKDTLATLSEIATRRGSATARAFDISASFPIKSDIAKLDKIRAFETKPRENLTPRAVVALVVAYILRDTENGFSRVFPTGLFIENGCLRDLTTAGFITADDGDAITQRFTFSDKVRKSLFTDKAVLTLENTLADGGLV